MMRLLCALLATAVASVSAHKYGLGGCANVRPMDGFEPSRIAGLWYVHQGFSMSSSCITFNYTLTDNGLKLLESKELKAMDAIGVEHKYTAVGTLRDNGLPGLYEATFSTNPVKSRYVFMTTDYDNYAGVYHCQHLGKIVHRRNVYVLSRKPTVDDIYIEKVKRRMSVFDLDPENLESTHHNGCIPAEESDINVRFDGSLFNLSGDELDMFDADAARAAAEQEAEP